VGDLPLLFGIASENKKKYGIGTIGSQELEAIAFVRFVKERGV